MFTSKLFICFYSESRKTVGVANKIPMHFVINGMVDDNVVQFNSKLPPISREPIFLLLIKWVANAAALTQRTFRRQR